MRGSIWRICITGRFIVAVLLSLLSLSAKSDDVKIFANQSTAETTCAQDRAAFFGESLSSCSRDNDAPPSVDALCSNNNANKYYFSGGIYYYCRYDVYLSESGCQTILGTTCDNTEVYQGRFVLKCAENESRDSSGVCQSIYTCPVGTLGSYPICNGEINGQAVQTQPRDNENLPSCDSEEAQNYYSNLCADHVFQCNQGDLQYNYQRPFCSAPDFDPNKAYQYLQWMDPADNQHITSNTRQCYSNDFYNEVSSCNNEMVYCYDAGGTVWAGACQNGAMLPNKEPSCDKRKYILQCENVFVCENGARETIAPGSPYYTDPSNCNSSGQFYQTPQSDTNNETGSTASASDTGYTPPSSGSSSGNAGSGGEGTGGGGFAGLPNSGGGGGFGGNNSSGSSGTSWQPCQAGDSNCVEQNTGSECQEGQVCVTVHRPGVESIYQLPGVDTFEQSNQRLIEGINSGPTISGINQIRQMDFSGSGNCPVLTLDTGSWFGQLSIDSHCQIIQNYRFTIQMFSRVAWVLAAILLFLGA